MCPVCITTAALIAGSVTSSGGLAAVAIKKLGGKSTGDKHPNSNASMLSGNENETE
jgi:hypothetical protein